MIFRWRYAGSTVATFKMINLTLTNLHHNNPPQHCFIVWWEINKCPYITSSVTKLGDLLDFGELLKAFDNN